MEEMKYDSVNENQEQESVAEPEDRLSLLEDEWEKTNQKYLDIFEADMKAAGRSKRTLRTSMDYADTYINYFLFRLVDESQDLEKYKITDENLGILEEGCKKIGYYISYYYIYKDLSATTNNLKVVVRSIRNFYRCMCDHGFVSKDSYDYLCCIIKMEKDEWLEECEIQHMNC